ncbi:MAG: hypothetical protein J1F11_12550 [Oscillospiraceae bacterium]|nr:hypothetical protein [Oscillospiraceae bacterium]
MTIEIETLLKFGGAMLGLLLIVWLIALLTPKAAGLIDKLKKPSPERVQDSITSENIYHVYSIFEDRPDGAVNGMVESSEKSDGDSKK